MGAGPILFENFIIVKTNKASHNCILLLGKGSGSDSFYFDIRNSDIGAGVFFSPKGNTKDWSRIKNGAVVHEKQCIIFSPND